MIFFDRKFLVEIADFFFSNNKGVIANQVRAITYFWIIPGIIFFLIDYSGVSRFANSCKNGERLVEKPGDFDPKDWLQTEVKNNARYLSYPGCFDERKTLETISICEDKKTGLFYVECSRTEINKSSELIKTANNWINNFQNRLIIIILFSYPAYLLLSLLVWAFNFKKEASENTTIKSKNLENEIKHLEEELRFRELEAKKEELKKKLGK